MEQTQQEKKQRRPRLRQSKEVRRAKRKARKVRAREAAALQPEVKVQQQPSRNKARIDKPYMARVWPVASIVNEDWPANRQALVLRRAVAKVFCIIMKGGLKVTGIPMDAFDRDFVPFEYDVQKAARRYLDHGNKLAGITDLAREALQAIIQGEVDMSSIENKVAGQGEAETTAAKAAPKKPKTKKDKAKKPSKAVVTKSKANGKEKPSGKKAKAKDTAKKTERSAANRIDTSLKIKKLVKDNPRREGSQGHKNWSLYREGMTVESYMAQKGAALGHVHWDVGHGYIKLSK